MVLGHQAKDELTGDDKRFLVGQADLLAGLNGVDGRYQTCKAHHRSQHGIYRSGLHDFFQSFLSRIDFDVGTVRKRGLQFLVVILIGDDHSGRIELSGLCGQLLHTVVRREAVDLIAVGVLGDDVKSCVPILPVEPSMQIDCLRGC